MCAAPLATVPASRGVRKRVTIVFCDLAHSTEMGERLDAESLRQVLSRYYEVSRSALERHGGSVEKYIGDAVMAVFGVPVVHEDDALRAVRAAAEMRRDLAALNELLETEWHERLETRTGVNTGEVVAGDPTQGQVFAVGDAVNVAARLEQAAQPGEILLGAETYRLVRDAVRVESLEPIRVKGKAASVQAYRLAGVEAEAPRSADRARPALVGRDEELAELDALFSRAVGTSSCQLVTVVGSAGVGKSRLVDEFVRQVEGRAAVLGGRCLSYGERITYWPIAQLVRQAAGIAEADSATGARSKISDLLPDEPRRAAIVGAVSSAIGLSDDPADREEIAWAFRELIAALGRERPVVVVFDDLHWAAPALLDLVVATGRMNGEIPLLVVCVARPDVGELNADLAASPGFGHLVLEPLEADASAALIEQLLGDAPLGAALRAQLTEGAEGNPLFIEEMVATLIEDGVIREGQDGWEVAGDLSSIAIPPSIEALLSARLDRLEADSRGVAERAAVVGYEFWRAALEALSPEAGRSRLTEDLRSLVERRFALCVAGEQYRFHHILIREAVYRALLKESRVELHERFADWLERRAGDRVPEYEEILGYHLEQACHYREQLASSEARDLALAGRAAGHLGAAGRRALTRGDMSAAVDLIERATRLLPPQNPARLDLLHSLIRALRESGAFSARGMWRGTGSARLVRRATGEPSRASRSSRRSPGCSPIPPSIWTTSRRQQGPPTPSWRRARMPTGSPGDSFCSASWRPRDCAMALRRRRSIKGSNRLGDVGIGRRNPISSSSAGTRCCTVPLRSPRRSCSARRCWQTLTDTGGCRERCSGTWPACARAKAGSRGRAS